MISNSEDRRGLCPNRGDKVSASAQNTHTLPPAPDQCELCICLHNPPLEVCCSFFFFFTRHGTVQGPPAGPKNSVHLDSFISDKEPRFRILTHDWWRRGEERTSGNKRGMIRDKEGEEEVTGYGRGSEAGGGSDGTQ